MPKFDNYKMPLAGLLTTIAVITLGIVDLVMVLTKGTGGSVSNFLINAGVRSPTVVFMVGFVCGHLWGPMYKSEPEPDS